MFDIRASAVTWESNFGGGGVTSLTLLEDKRLAGSGAGGVATVWDLATKHKSLGFTKTDLKVDKSVIWSLSPSPDNENIFMSSLSSGGVHLVRFRPPGHR